MLNHLYIIRAMQTNLSGLTMPSVGLIIAPFLSKHKIIAPERTAGMLDNLSYLLGPKIVYLAFQNTSWHRLSQARVSYPQWPIAPSLGPPRAARRPRTLTFVGLTIGDEEF